MKDGVIADFTVTEQMLKQFIKRSAPAGCSAQPAHRDLRAVRLHPGGAPRHQQSALSAGARRVELIEEPMAAAIGAGLPVEEATGSMVVDIGGGTTEVGGSRWAALCIPTSVRVGGDNGRSHHQLHPSQLRHADW